jgi:hypothetical protein
VCETRLVWRLRSVFLLPLSLIAAGCDPDRRADTPEPPTATASTSRASSTASPTPTPTALVPPGLRKYCHTGYPLAGVWSPRRLDIKSPCVAITGIVGDMRIEHDGDLHISLLKVDPKWLNRVNLERKDHALVVEGVPDIPVSAPAKATRAR